MNPAHEGRGSPFSASTRPCRMRRDFFFTRAQNKRPLLRIHRRLSALYPLQGGEGGIASLNNLTKSRTTPYGIDPRCDARKAPSTFPALLPRAFHTRRQRPFLLSDEITARSAPRGGQTQAGRTSEPTASPYHNEYNDRHEEPAPRSRRRPAATQGGKVIPREGAKLTQRHKIRRKNTATHRNAGARYVLRDGRAYAAVSCHSTQESRTTSASSEEFGKVGIGQGLKTETRRSRCDCSKASPDSALLIQRVRFLRKFPSSSRSLVICEENDNCVRAPQGFASMVPPRPHARYAIAITRRNPSAHSRPGRTSQRAHRAHNNKHPYTVNACCPVPSLREKALRLCAT